MSSLFISSDLGTVSSGNIVSTQELEAIESLYKKCATDTVFKLGYNKISPTTYNLPNHPFIQDYITMNYIADLELDKNEVNLAHFYSGPFTNTMRYLKAKYPHIIITNTIDAHNRQESIKEFESLGYQYPFNHIKDQALYKIYSRFLKEAHILITPSKISKKCLISDGAKPDNIAIIPHGINIPNPDQIKPFPEEFKAGYIGAYGADKGIKYLIQSWSSLKYQDDSELLLGGANAIKDLEPFIRRFSTGGQFRLLGYIQNISDFYNSISIYIQPSVTEGWGIEVVEAASYGRPIICSNGAGASDCITDGKDGFIVEKRNVKELSEKIQYFKDNPNEIIRMGKNAIERSLQYNWKSIRNMYIDLWRSLT